MLKSEMEFSLADDEQCQRLAYRTAVHGIEARINGKQVQPVVDISVSGCAFQISNGFATHEGDVFPIQLEVKGRAIITNLRAKVIRITPRGVAACNFVNLGERQEYALDKLVLEIQKRIIEKKKM